MKGKSISKKEAGILQGIAVLLMVFHHLFDFPDRIHVPFVNVFAFIKLELFVSSFGRICVAMFAFLSGFGLYKKYIEKLKDKKFPVFSCYRGMVGQLINFLKRYWIVFAIFIPYGLIANVYTFGWEEFFKNLLGLSSTYNKEWWYVLQYFDFLLMFPIVFCVEKWLAGLIKKNGECWSSLCVSIPLVIVFVWQGRVYNVCFLLGMLSVSTNAMDKLIGVLEKTSFWRYGIAAIFIAMAFISRVKVLGGAYDYINVVLLIAGLLIIIKSKLFKNLFNSSIGFVGKYSTYIWLTHTFYAYYFFQKFTFYPKYSILIYLWCVALSLMTGIILEYILKAIAIVLEKMKITLFFTRLVQKSWHFLERVIKESKQYPKTKKVFGKEIAKITFKDGIIPPGKHPRYIQTIQNYVNNFLEDVVEKHKSLVDESVYETEGKLHIWCCWWQGTEQMPEIVTMCHERLKSIIPQDRAELHVITLDNYLQYVEIPHHIIDKFNRKIITMTTMSDILRFRLLEKYGGYWLDATVFFTGGIPQEYFQGKFYCQRMASDFVKVEREACKGNWCGFSMAGPAHSPVFRFMNDAFDKWWAHYDTIIEYVLIDYMLMTGFTFVPQIHEIINSVPDNNPDIFDFYKKLNEPYTRELYEELTANNVMHKLTYKMDLHKTTKDNQDTLYGYLFKEIMG